MLDDTTPVSDQDATDDTPSTPTQRPRRRAVSRPAGPPKQVEASEAVVPVTQAAGSASVAAPTEEPDEAPAAPKRRRATRKAAAPAPVAAPTQVVETVGADKAAAAEPEVAQQALVAEQAPASVPLQGTQGDQAAEKPARRSRSRKKAPAVEFVPAAPSEAADEQPQVDVEVPAAAALDAPLEDVQPRARKSTRKRAPRTQAPAEDVDSALAAVTAAAAERPRRGRKVSTAVANPFITPTLPVDENGDVDAQAVLNSLAASIAGDVTDVADDLEAEVAAPGEDVAQEQLAEEDSDEAPADETADDEDAAEDASDDDQSDDDPSDEEDGGPRRRRRRRGGRRRRRSTDQGDDDPADESDEDEPKEGADEAPDGESSDSAEGNDQSEQDDQSSESGRRRRSRRRRRGEDTGGADDDPSDVVVRVREPRKIRTAAQANDEVTGIDGSTRMEAKKQRRREGRAAGRRRAPILSEAEFLARRESVTRRMVIRQNDEYTQLAVLEDDVLVEHYVDRASSSSLIGNIYLGRVQNVLPSMEAAFVDIGRGRNAVLYAGEIDWDAYGEAGAHKKVEQVLKSGQTVLVQVSKDPVGAKGARLTSHISLPGRYVVYSPGGHLSGISRKLADAERHRLKDILGDLIDDKSSVIVRTAAEGASEDELVRDVNRLKAQWEVIEKKSKQGSAPQQLYAEPDLTVRIVRDLFTEDFTELVVSGNGAANDAYEAINAYVAHVAPHLGERLTQWDVEAQGDPFGKYRIDDQIAKALERKVFLPSGGSLVIDRTEAMTVIDVNTGKFTGTGGNLEATVTSNNLEAAEEIVRQLRLRDIGGIIVIDFIDMVLPSNRELLLRRLVECLGRDRTRHQVAEVTSLGLVQMTRKKIGTGLAEAFTIECEGCGGRGFIRHDHPVETQAPADGGERHGGRRGRKH